jgi:hypothetical protein
MPARGLREGAEQHAEMYSCTGPRTTTGLATGLAFFAHLALFEFRVSSWGFCALPEDFCTVGFAVCFPAEDLFCCFIFNHFGTGLESGFGVDEVDAEEVIDFGVVELGAAHMCSPLYDDAIWW